MVSCGVFKRKEKNVTFWDNRKELSNEKQVKVFSKIRFNGIIDENHDLGILAKRR